MKAFHQKTYGLGKNILTRVILTNPLLTENNVDFNKVGATITKVVR